MYLSKIDIFGFKSFSNKTSVLLNDGITAIVGPNGCGKTNIVDALRWALGEQRYSTLRSDKMEDVIFNGTKVRKPINMAEVSLTIQNNKEVLPIEYDELTVTRRIYRSGESEYLLNKTTTRLKDIVSLFMDTGMGSNAYSVIELKMIESILSDKVEERRRLFEEAAGVTKYKTKRREAFRRLADVEADLVRVNDIMSEVTKAVNSLNRQAKKAERYNQYMERLRSLDLEVLQRDYTSLNARLTPLEERLSIAFNERESLNHRVTEHETLLNEYKKEELESEEELAEARKGVAHFRTIASEFDQKLLVDKERQKATTENLERLKNAKVNYQQRLIDNQKEKTECTQNAVSIRAELDEIERRAEIKRASHSELLESVRLKKEEMQERQTVRMQAVQELSKRNNELENIGQRKLRIEELLKSHESNKNDAEEKLRLQRTQLEEQSKGQISISEAVASAERVFHEMEERKETLRKEIDLHQNRAFELQSKIGEKLTKIDFLNGLIDRLEGYSESVKHLINNKEWSAQSNTTIAEVVNTKAELRVAVEAALSDAAYYIVVKDVSEAVSGLRNLRDYKKGKATFVCLNNIPETEAVPFPLAGDGVLGWAYDLIEFQPEYKKLFSYLLKNTLIVRDAEVARASTREYPQLHCVSLDGDTFSSNGIVKGGSQRKDEGSLIGKKDQIQSLSHEVEKLQADLSENQALLAESSSEFDGIDLRHFAERMKQSQQNLSAHERAVAQIRFEVEKLERILENNATEQQALSQEQESISRRLAELQPEIAQLEERSKNLEQDEERARTESEELDSEYGKSNAELNEMQIAITRLKGMLNNLEQDIQRLTNSYTDTEEALERAEQETKKANETLIILEEEGTQYEQELTAAKSHFEEAELKLKAIQEKVNEKREHVQRLEKTLHDEREKHGQSVSLVHEIELKGQEIRQRIEALRLHATEEFELTLELKEQSDDDVFDLAQAKDEISDLRVKIKSLGLVNPLAFEEWKKEKERMDVLNTQYDDLVEAEKTLTETIGEINHTAQEKFIETFSKVRENFINIFQSLFDEGDEADLILLESDDPLEAKIDITAKPRGKRPHSIEMLSGGEKTLTAIALLFAIYLVKPSPFCILDEVDAPLDDANIDRFIKILRQFSDNTQFIVVTHNKLTMEAADTLYGVTMEEEGISKLVAVRFEDDLSRFLN
jgi:chromosome segregation protein